MLPDRVNIGYQLFWVKPYILAAFKCYKCQRFGHVAAVCKGKTRCGKCGHCLYENCMERTDLKCSNCGDKYSAAYKGCAAVVHAKEVQKIKTIH